MQLDHDEQYWATTSIRGRQSQPGSHSGWYKLDGLRSGDSNGMLEAGNPDVDNTQPWMGRFHDIACSCQFLRYLAVAQGTD